MLFSFWYDLTDWIIGAFLKFVVSGMIKATDCVCEKLCNFPPNILQNEKLENDIEDRGWCNLR